jgi:hypothetical protein
VLIGCSLVIYVAPTIIGWQRRVAGAGALAILNVLLGWTGVGWIVCMLWAVRAYPHQNQFYRNQTGSSQSSKLPSTRNLCAGRLRSRCRSARDAHLTRPPPIIGTVEPRIYTLAYFQGSEMSGSYADAPNRMRRNMSLQYPLAPLQAGQAANAVAAALNLRATP